MQQDIDMAPLNPVKPPAPEKHKKRAFGEAYTKIKRGQCKSTRNSDFGKKKWKDEYIIQVKMLAMLGATQASICEFFDITENTLIMWFRCKLGFHQAYMEGGILSNATVAHALYRRAVGWEHEATKIFCNKDGETTIVPYTERYPADTTAALKWLQAREGGIWNIADKKEITGADGGAVEVSHVQVYLPDNKRVIDLETE